LILPLSKIIFGFVFGDGTGDNCGDGNGDDGEGMRVGERIGDDVFTGRVGEINGANGAGDIDIALLSEFGDETPP
jgi:hypothetical protein